MLVPSVAVRLVCAVSLLCVTAAGCSAAVGSGVDGAAEAAAGPRPVDPLQSKLDQLTTSFAMNPQTDVSIAALDTVDGRSMQYGATRDMVAASAVKVEILVATLLQHQDAGTTLSDADDARATQMIQSSDNDAASALFDEVGGTAALNATSARLHLTHTQVGDDGYFGFTLTDAQDQITLLRALTDPTSPLDADGRGYALGLMRDVNADESWGVTAAADSGSTPAVKNGWLPLDSDQGRWAVTSMGVVAVDGHQTLLVVFTQHQDQEQYGIDYIERASRLVAAGLATTPPR